jgi:geranyl-CoA carboxylase alpha subunit
MEGCTTVSCGESPDEKVELVLLGMDSSHCRVERNGVRERIPYAFDGDRLYLDDGTGHYSFDDVTQEPSTAAAVGGSGQIRASMDGAIIDVLARVGDVVSRGQTLVVLEAMKMEHQLKADTDGVVESVNAATGDQVKERQLLVTVAAETSSTKDDSH